MKKFFNSIKKLLNGTAKTEWVNAGLCDFSGEGRNKYGK